MGSGCADVAMAAAAYGVHIWLKAEAAMLSEMSCVLLPFCSDATGLDRGGQAQAREHR